MPEITQRTFRVTLDVTVRVNEIDDALAEKTKEGFNNPTLARDPMTAEGLTRDRHLLAALLADPVSLREVVLQRVLWSLEFIHPLDDSLEPAHHGLGSDLQVVERLRSALSEAEYEFLHELAEEDVFYDNTSFFQEAFTVEQTEVQIQDVAVTDANAANSTGEASDVSDGTL